MQMLILAGGLVTRLHPLTERLPKCMVAAGGKPFLEHQLRLLVSRGVRDIVICVGYLGHKVLEYFGDGHHLGAHLTYAWERNGLLGTAGAVRNAEGLLAPEFFVAGGDSYPPLDYRAIMTRFRRSDALAMMVVHRSEDRLRRSNVAVSDGYVTAYDRTTRLRGMAHEEQGLTVVRRRALRLIPPGLPFSQAQFLGMLVRRRQLLAYETKQPTYEIGSPQGLAEFRRLAASGGLS